MSRNKRDNGFLYHVRENLILHFLEPLDSEVSFALGVSFAVAGPVVIGLSIVLASLVSGSVFWILGVIVIIVGSIVVYGLVGLVAAIVSGVLDTRSGNRGLATRVSIRTSKRMSRGYAG